MTERKWTPGPWGVDPLGLGTVGDVMTACGNTSVAQAQQIRSTIKEPDQSERRSNAHLIAAAPDLYEALENARDALKYGAEYSESNWVIAAADAALAKARGEA